MGAIKLKLSNKGTPKTMAEAIENGIEATGLKFSDDLTIAVKAHVVDFLRNQFAITALRTDDDKQTEEIMDLLNRVIR